MFWLQDNLDRFEEVYKWLFPREVFDKPNFIPDYKDPEDVLEKSIMLDSFFEDIVLRRNDTSSSIEVSYHFYFSNHIFRF